MLQVQQDSEVEQDSHVQDVQDVQDVQHVHISFENIDPRVFQHSGQYKCALSTAGQVINSLNDLATQIGNGTKIATNDYQKCLYPSIGTIANNVVTKYISTFVDNVDEPLTKQVFGANLNGSRNDGRLNRPVTIRGVNRFLKYEYSQLGQLLNLLRHRLTFVSSRNVSSIKRYAENDNERTHFVTLQELTQTFCTYLSDEIYPQWEQFVNDARIQNSIKLNADNVGEVADKVQREQNVRQFRGGRGDRQLERPVRQFREPRQFDNRDGQQRPPRQFDNRDGQQKPPRQFDNRDGQERPPRQFDNRDGQERPPRQFDNRDGQGGRGDSVVFSGRGDGRGRGRGRGDGRGRGRGDGRGRGRSDGRRVESDQVSYKN
jgi:hypothetical protein